MLREFSSKNWSNSFRLTFTIDLFPDRIRRYNLSVNIGVIFFILKDDKSMALAGQYLANIVFLLCSTKIVATVYSC